MNKGEVDNQFVPGEPAVQFHLFGSHPIPSSPIESNRSGSIITQWSQAGVMTTPVARKSKPTSKCFAQWLEFGREPRESGAFRSLLPKPYHTITRLFSSTASQANAIASHHHVTSRNMKMKRVRVLYLHWSSFRYDCAFRSRFGLNLVPGMTDWLTRLFMTWAYASDPPGGGLSFKMEGWTFSPHRVHDFESGWVHVVVASLPETREIDSVDLFIPRAECLWKGLMCRSVNALTVFRVRS